MVIGHVFWTLLFLTRGHQSLQNFGVDGALRMLDKLFEMMTNWPVDHLEDYDTKRDHRATHRLKVSHHEKLTIWDLTSWPFGSDQVCCMCLFSFRWDVRLCVSPSFLGCCAWTCYGVDADHDSAWLKSRAPHSCRWDRAYVCLQPPLDMKRKHVPHSLVWMLTMPVPMTECGLLDLSKLPNPYFYRCFLDYYLSLY